MNDANKKSKVISKETLSKGVAIFKGLDKKYKVMICGGMLIAAAATGTLTSEEIKSLIMTIMMFLG